MSAAAITFEQVDAQYPYDPHASPEAFRELEKLRGIESPKLRRQLFDLWTNLNRGAAVKFSEVIGELVRAKARAAECSLLSKTWLVVAVAGLDQDARLDLQRSLNKYAGSGKTIAVGVTNEGRRTVTFTTDDEFYGPRIARALRWMHEHGLGCTAVDVAATVLAAVVQVAKGKR